MQSAVLLVEAGSPADGETVARNLDAELDGRPPEAFTFHDKGFVVSVGTRRGVADIAGITGWLVQVGVLRGGWYADDLLDNFARPSVRRIVPELQDLRVGQRLAMVPRPSERTLSSSTASPSRQGCCGARRIAPSLGG